MMFCFLTSEVKTYWTEEDVFLRKILTFLKKMGWKKQGSTSELFSFRNGGVFFFVFFLMPGVLQKSLFLCRDIEYLERSRMGWKSRYNRGGKDGEWWIIMFYHAPLDKTPWRSLMIDNRLFFSVEFKCYMPFLLLFRNTIPLSFIAYIF